MSQNLAILWKWLKILSEKSSENPLMMDQPKIKHSLLVMMRGVFSFSKIVLLTMHLVQQKIGFSQKEWKWSHGFPIQLI